MFQDLSTASSAALLLQERIDILQIALNDETSSGNHPRQTSSQVEAESDSIWSEIVDEQSKVRIIFSSFPFFSLSSFVTLSSSSRSLADFF